MVLPEGGVSVEVADNILAILDFTEKVFLTWDFSVLSMAFRQPLLQKRELRWLTKQQIINCRKKNTFTFEHNEDVEFHLLIDLGCEQ